MLIFRRFNTDRSACDTREGPRPDPGVTDLSSTLALRFGKMLRLSSVRGDMPDLSARSDGCSDVVSIWEEGSAYGSVSFAARL